MIPGIIHSGVFKQIEEKQVIEVMDGLLIEIKCFDGGTQGTTIPYNTGQNTGI